MITAVLWGLAQGAAAPTLLRPTTLERGAGWRSVTLAEAGGAVAWRLHASGGAPAGGWEVRDGALHLAVGQAGGDLFAPDARVANFELEFEWQVAPGANSGIKYRVADRDAEHLFGLEYQLLDDTGHAEGAIAKHRAGALYDLNEPRGSTVPAAGEFHRGRIVAREGRIEHWLAGRRVVLARIGSPEWSERLAASKFAARRDFGLVQRGRIGIQDHGGEVWLRNVVLRDLDALPGERVELVHDAQLSGWRRLGDARYTLDDGAILGEVTGGAQSFLVTERQFGDFILELEVKNELPGNSGIQVRSQVQPDGRLYGYQIEIDPSARAWSGGLYDEARRGWLDDLSDDEEARAAFRPGEWNHYRIECLGPWIRAWVDGVPTADWFDDQDLEGVIGLQVHSGNDTRVRWRNLMLRDLGTRRWIPAAIEALRFTALGGPGAKARLEQRVNDGSGVFELEHEEPVRIELPRGERDFALRFELDSRSSQARVVVETQERVPFDVPPHAQGAEWQSVTLIVDGARVACRLDGRTIEAGAVEGDSEPTPSAGPRSLRAWIESSPSEPRPCRTRVRGIEILGAPRR